MSQTHSKHVGGGVGNVYDEMQGWDYNSYMNPIAPIDKSNKKREYGGIMES